MSKSLKKELLSGFFYSALTKYSSMFIQLGVTAFLARLLTPYEFGLVAIVSVFVVFFGLFADMGLAPSIIQNKTLDKSDLNSLFTFTLLLGLLLALLFFFTAAWFARFYEQTDLRRLFEVTSLVVLLSAVNIVPNALMLKNKFFKLIMVRQLAIAILSGVLGVLIAMKGYGVYALIAMQIFSSTITFVVNFLKFPLMIRFPYMNVLDKVAGFSAYQLGFNFINYFARNLDKLLIGKYISPISLGFYEKSYRLMLLPVENLTHVLTPVLQPVLNDIGTDKEKVFHIYMKVIRILALIGFPLSIFLHFSAKELIVLVFGNQWIASIPVFEILAYTVGVQIILSSSGAIFQISNRPDLLFVLGLISAILTVGSICLGVFVFRSTIAVAYGLLLAFTANFLICYYVLFRMLKRTFFDFFKLLLMPLFLAILTFLTFKVLVFDFSNLLLSISLKGFVLILILASFELITSEFRRYFKLLKQ